MSYAVGEMVLIKRSNGTTSPAKIIDKSNRFVNIKNGSISTTTTDLAIGTHIQDKTGNVFKVTACYKVTLYDDKFNPIDTKPILTCNIVHSLRDIYFSRLPDDIQWKINSAWVDSLNEYDQTDCKEYKDFEARLTDDAVPTSYLLPSDETLAAEKKKKMLHEKKLEIVKKNVEKLKLFMIKYKDDLNLVKKIRDKLNTIIRNYYGKGEPFEFNGGAHPEYLMNIFIYNPSLENNRFKVLRINKNQVTYQLYETKYVNGKVNYTLTGETKTDPLDKFLKDFKMFDFFPNNDPQSTPETNEWNVNKYLYHLMETFEKKPDIEFLSVPPKQDELMTMGGYKNFNGKRMRRNNKLSCKNRLKRKNRTRKRWNKRK